MDMISQGAEAVLYSEKGHIVKKRVPKGYRHPDLDISLRARRTRREVKVLEKLSGIADVPRLICHSDGKRVYGTMPEGIALGPSDIFIIMERVDGEKLKDVLSSRNLKGLMQKTARLASMMHSNDIVHGDLTTSNMIRSGAKLFLIDFGLSLFSDKIEDKAVDIHLLKKALESGHPDICERSFEAFADAYKDSYTGSADVLDRLEQVENRGRKKLKGKGGNSV